MPAPPGILESDEDGVKGGKLLGGGIHGCSVSDARRPTIPHHFQYGGGCGSASLYVGDGVGSGRAGREWTRGWA